MPDIAPPEPRVVKAVDYDITLNCGKEVAFTLLPHQGDTETLDDEHLTLFLAPTEHHTVITISQVAIMSRRVRDMELLPEGYMSQDKRAKKDKARDVGQPEPGN